MAVFVKVRISTLDTRSKGMVEMIADSVTCPTRDTRLRKDPELQQALVQPAHL
jgi:hypothetical protein